METDESDSTANIRLRGAKSANAPLLPEVDCYLHLLVLLHLIDSGNKQNAVKCSDVLIDKVASHNRRSLDHVAGKPNYFQKSEFLLENGFKSFFRSMLFLPHFEPRSCRSTC